MYRTILAVLTFSAVASANTYSFNTPAGATTGGGAVDASAVFTTNANGTISITLTDLQANPTDVAQLLSDLDFVLSNGATTGVLTSSSGALITVNGNGTFTTAAATSTGWGLNSNVGGGIQLDALGFIGPAGLIIGPPGGATYSNANGSIAGNNPHNPFINQTATFLVTVAGVTDATAVTSATFSFGTTAGINVGGCVVGTTNCAPTVPEPISSALVGTGLIGLFFLGRRRIARKA